MKKLKILSVLMAVLIIFSGCGESGAEGKNYWFATGKSGGTYYALGTSIVGIWEEYGSFTANISTTTGSVENIELIEDGEMDFAFAQSDILYYALEGDELFNNDAQKNISVIANLYTEAVQVVVSAESEIESIADLTGKIVAVGENGTATEAAARQILEAYGVSYDMITVKYDTFSESEEGLKNGTVDAVFAVSSLPSKNILAFAEEYPIKLLPISSQIGTKLKKTCPFFSDGVIKNEVYNTESSVFTLCIDVLLICRSDLSVNEVYNVTSALFDNLDTLANENTRGAEINIENASETKVGEIHSGAKKYYASVLDSTEG